ncbi:MAG TPA: hypothetical protein VMD91_08440 [Candidatus Sulfotelmatobacter sp.]|nr:hypothetical protein [Candidatus Sulfotelmatobacter sp.]
MKLSFQPFLAAAVAATAVLGSAPSSAQAAIPAPWVGAWYAKPLTGGIADLVIRRSGGGPLLSVDGQCEPTACAWGTVSLSYSPDGMEANAIYRTSFAIRQLQLTLSPNGEELTVVDLTHFTDGSGRPDYTHTDTLFPIR